MYSAQCFLTCQANRAVELVVGTPTVCTGKELAEDTGGSFLPVDKHLCSARTPLLRSAVRLNC